MILPDTMRILVVDDNDYARAVAQAMLMRIGVKDIVDAASGADAIGHLLNEHFDLLLTDWYMPEISGSGLIRVVRSPGFGHNGTVPIAIMTAYATRENIGAAKALGITEILIKPLERSQLAGTLMRAVNAAAQEVLSQQVFLGD